MANTSNNLRFTTNWNNKLFGRYWTTLRLWNPRKYAVGLSYEVYLKDEYLGIAECMSVRKTKSADLNQFVAGLDTGYTVPRAQAIISKMYSNKENPEMVFALFRWVKIQEGCSVDLKFLQQRIKQLS